MLAAWWIVEKTLLRWVEPLAIFAIALAAVLVVRRLVLPLRVGNSSLTSNNNDW